MGVLECNKIGCHNIMCDTYIPSVGYICNSCIEDFKEQYKGGHVETELEGWLDKEKSTIATDLDEFFEQYRR